MIEDEVEVQQRIHQIQKRLQVRREKASECKMSLNRLLKPRISPRDNFDMEMHNRTCPNPNSPKSIHRLPLKAASTNEMKELQTLLDKKNMLRAIQVRIQEEELRKEKLKEQTQRDKTPHEKQNPDQGTYWQNVLQTTIIQRKDKPNPFRKVEVEKIVELNEQVKGKSKDQVSSALKKFFGVGLVEYDSTARYYNNGANLEADKLDSHTRSACSNSRLSRSINNHSRMQSTNGKCRETMYHHGILTNEVKKFNPFSNRLQKILRSHGDFWKGTFIVE